MSDISIPGINSRLNTENLIQELVDAESIRLTRMKGELEEYQIEKRVWQELNGYLGNLRNSTRNLFSFENPFNERNAISSNGNILQANASREAIEGVTKLKVVQIAQSDRFISHELDNNKEIANGIYGFTIGNESVTLRFRGGSVTDFSRALNRRNSDILRSSVVKTRPNSQVILIESLLEGSSYPLNFTDDTIKLAKDIGWVEEKNIVEFDTSNVVSNTGETANISVDGEIILSPGQELTIPLSKPIKESKNTILQYELKLSVNDGYRIIHPPLPPGPSLPNLGSVSLRDVTLPNIPSMLNLPEMSAEEQEIIEEYSLLFIRNGNERITLPSVRNSEEFILFQIPLEDYTTGFDAIEMQNPNTLKDFTIRNIKLLNTNMRGNFRPLHAVSTIQNAILEIEGIPVERESNTIDDLIPGVTLELQKASDEEIEIQVEPDRQLVKESLIEWVHRYNLIIRDINILTRTNQEIIDEIEYFNSEEKQEYERRLGMFQGDSTLNTLRQGLQNLSSNGYETGGEIALLAQIGISTNASGGSSGINLSRLRGYLEINENVLDESLQNDFLAVKDLFGYDSDGDIVIDNGVAFEIDKLIQSFVAVGGIISTRMARYDSIITSSNEDIRDYEEHLEDYEVSVRREFGAMESAVNSLESSAQGLQNLNSLNGNNSQ